MIGNKEKSQHKMNRYMSYQYSNSNYSYSSPLSSDRPKLSSTSTASRPSAGTASGSSRFKSTYEQRHEPSSKFQTNRHKTNELPWSSLLASSRRYPTTGSTASSSLNESVKHGTSSLTSHRYDGTSAALSSTISGRSLFDYSGPRTAINTPASRIYDGQLRRTATTRYTRTTNLDGPASPSARGQLSSRTPSTNQPGSGGSIVDTKRASRTTSTKTSTSLSTCDGVVAPSANASSPNDPAKPTSSSLTRPFRSSSLKLRTSYANILDQLTSTTLAKLRLGPSTTSSSFASRSKHFAAASSIGNTSASKPTLDVVPDEPEPETEDGQKEAADSRIKFPTSHHLDCLATNNGSQLTTTSPGSSSSGLSSSGIVTGGASSPTQSSISSYQAARSPAPMKSLNRSPGDSKLIDSGNSNDDEDEISSNSSTCDMLASKRDRTIVHEDARMDDDGDGADSSNEQESEDEEVQQRTMVSPVSRRLSYLNKELGAENNRLATRDNLVKTGAILSELDKFNEDLQVLEARDDNGASLTKSVEYLDSEDLREPQGNQQVGGVNESELILKLGSDNRKQEAAGNSDGLASKQSRHDASQLGSFSSALDWYQPAPLAGQREALTSSHQNGTAKQETSECGPICGSGKGTADDEMDPSEVERRDASQSADDEFHLVNKGRRKSGPDGHTLELGSLKFGGLRSRKRTLDKTAA